MHILLIFNNQILIKKYIDQGQYVPDFSNYLKKNHWAFIWCSSCGLKGHIAPGWVAKTYTFDSFAARSYKQGL